MAKTGGWKKLAAEVKPLIKLPRQSLNWSKRNSSMNGGWSTPRISTASGKAEAWQHMGPCGEKLETSGCTEEIQTGTKASGECLPAAGNNQSSFSSWWRCWMEYFKNIPDSLRHFTTNAGGVIATLMALGETFLRGDQSETESVSVII